MEGIVGRGDDVIAVYGCPNFTDGPSTRLMSLTTAGAAPIVTSWPAYQIDGVAYHFALDSIVLLVGKCQGLGIYRFDTKGSLRGSISSIAAIEVGGRIHELDDGRGYGSAPPCTKLSAVRMIAASADGSSMAVGIAGPANASIFDRPVTLSIGTFGVSEVAGQLHLVAPEPRARTGAGTLSVTGGVVRCPTGDRVFVTREKGLAWIQDSNVHLFATGEWSYVTANHDGSQLLVQQSSHGDQQNRRSYRVALEGPCS